MKEKSRTNRSDSQNKGSFRLRVIRILYWPYKWLIFVPLLILITLIWGSLSILLATVFNAKTGMKYGGSPWAKLCCLAALVFVGVRQKENIISNQSYVVVI